MAESLCCPPETITTLLLGYTPIHNKKLKRRTGIRGEKQLRMALCSDAGRGETEKEDGKKLEEEGPCGHPRGAQCCLGGRIRERERERERFMSSPGITVPETVDSLLLIKSLRSFSNMGKIISLFR